MPRAARIGMDDRSRRFAMKFSNIVKSFLRDDRGMETVEWGVLAALIVVGLVTVVGTLGNNILAKFQTLQNATT
jgi:Flp pilus assembly pilin Flp